MCEFPSWIVDDQGKAHWLVDKDIEAAIEDGKLKSWLDATGHSAIHEVLGVDGKRCEGRNNLPAEFASDIKSGRCNRMARVEPMQAIKHVLDLLPIGLALFEEKYVGGGLDLSGCDLKGITLPTSVGGWLYLRGTKNAKLPVGMRIAGNVDLTDSDIESLPHGIDISGEILGKNIAKPQKCAPKKKRGKK